MQLLDKTFREPAPCVLNHKVNAAEVVYRFHDVVNFHRAASNAGRFRLEDVARLLVGQARAFDVV